MQNIVALIGPGRGPEIPLRAHPAHAHVRGLDGGELKIRHLAGEMVVSSDGIYPLPNSASVSVEYMGSNVGMVCSVRF